jgi:hypothetical protein
VSVRWLPLLLLGCSPGNFSEFRDRYVSRLCDNARHCGELGRNDPCPLPETLPRAGDLDVSSGIADGRLAFDSQHAQECLDALVDAPCDPGIVAIRIFEHCHHIVGPNLPTGAACHADEECVGGSCDGSFSCPGRCVAWPPPNAPCQPGGCDPTVEFCGGDPPLCRLKQLERGACTADDQCAHPFVCAGDQCLHHPRVGDGKECGFAGAVCDDGRYCSPSTGVCTGLHAGGSSCDARDGCTRGSGCSSADGGTCQPWADEAQPCTDGLCPLTQSCVPGGGSSDGGLDGTCRADPSLPAGPHESCEQRSCAAGLYCTRGHSCEYQRLLGGDCDPDDSGCLPGLDCTDDRCRPPSPSCAPPDAGTD